MFHFIILRTVILLSVVCAGVVGAQTRFEWPSKQADVATYTRWEECLGMARRVRDSMDAQLIRDTLSPQQKGRFNAEADVVIAATKRCAASIPLSSVSPEYTRLAQEVLLIAGRDADVLRLYRSRFAEVSTDVEKVQVIGQTIGVLLDAQPARLQLADSVLSDSRPYDSQWTTVGKLTLLGQLCGLSYGARNDVFIEKFCGSYLRTVDAMTEVERGAMGPPVSIGYIGYSRILRRAEFADSLTKSVEAYGSLLRELVRKSGWQGRWLYPVGEKAEPLVGDFWLPASAKNNQYPRPGKVTFITSTAMRHGGCGRSFMLKRIVERFPDLEIVVLSGTTGHFGPVEPPSATAESELLYRQLADFCGIPLVMAITKSPTWRLAGLDQRRIFDPYSHSDAYVERYNPLIGIASRADNRLYGWMRGLSNFGGLLVDDKGIIVDFVSDEEVLASYIDILMKRAKQ